MGELEDVAELVRACGGLVTMDQAQRCGWTRSRLRWAVARGLLLRLRQGVYTSTAGWNQADTIRRSRLVLMAHQRMSPRMAGSGLIAAAALGLPLPAEHFDAGRILTHPAELRRPRPGERAVRIRNGPLLVPMVELIMNCARCLPREWGLAVADAAIFEELTSEEQLQAVEVPVRSRGAAKVRWVFAHARAKVESPLESLARAVIILGGFPEPRVQRLVKTRRGHFRVDMIDEVASLITEADGKVKYGRRAKYRRAYSSADDAVWEEKLREDALRDEHEVIRFTMGDYYRQPNFLDRYGERRRRGLKRTTG